MTSLYSFETERLKPLVTCFLDLNFDNEAFPLPLKKSIRLAVKENIPLVMVSDGFHNMEAVFTKEAVNEFRKNYQIKFSSLREKVILVTKWSLKVQSSDSRKEYFSY